MAYTIDQFSALVRALVACHAPDVAPCDMFQCVGATQDERERAARHVLRALIRHAPECLPTSCDARDVRALIAAVAGRDVTSQDASPAAIERLAVWDFRAVATVALLVHYPRGRFPRRVRERERVRPYALAGSRYFTRAFRPASQDVDASAVRAGLAAERLRDATDGRARTSQPAHVEIARLIDTARLYGREPGCVDYRSRHASPTSGSQPGAIVTRVDRARRELQALAKTLDVLAAFARVGSQPAQVAAALASGAKAFRRLASGN